MTNTPSITQLQSDWFGFSDLDRASAILAIHQSGISIRKIAAQLQLSESLLRHLVQALQAPSSDRDLARQGKISTNELIRRAKVGLLPAKHHKTLTIDRDREIHIAADLICDWLLKTQLYGPAREAIVNEVRHKFLAIKEAGLHPSAVAAHGTPVSQIIKRAKPPALTDGSIDIVAWFAQWLCKWSFFAFPDEDVRDAALDLAR
jgi:transposase-like protein